MRYSIPYMYSNSLFSSIKFSCKHFSLKISFVHIFEQTEFVLKYFYNEKVNYGSSIKGDIVHVKGCFAYLCLPASLIALACSKGQKHFHAPLRKAGMALDGRPIAMRDLLVLSGNGAAAGDLAN